MYRIYQVRARKIENGYWKNLTEWLEPEPIKKKFLFWEYNVPDLKFVPEDFYRNKAVDIAKDIYKDNPPCYQDIIIVCSTLHIDSENDWWETETIWKNGLWI